MRLFIALALPAPVRAELAATVESLRSTAHPVRWADPAGFHLTLQFLDEVGEEQVASLVAALRAMPALPLQLGLGRLVAFPNRRQPRVLWVGVGDETAALAELHRSVLAATARLGFPVEQRGFSPHLTLGRVRQGARPEQLRTLGDALANAAPPAPLQWEAGPPTLFQSTLTPGGAVYTRLGS